MPTTSEVLAAIKTATDAQVQAVDDAFNRLAAIIANGGQVTQADLDAQKAIIDELTAETTKAQGEGV